MGQWEGKGARLSFPTTAISYIFVTHRVETPSFLLCICHELRHCSALLCVACCFVSYFIVIFKVFFKQFISLKTWGFFKKIDSEIVGFTLPYLHALKFTPS